MIRPYSLLLLSIVAVAAVADAQPAAAPALAPTTVTLQLRDVPLAEAAAALSKASGIPIAVAPGVARSPCSAMYAGVPFWDALERTARATDTKVVLLEKGTKIALEPRGECREVVAASGAFRIVAKQVVGRALLDLGATFHEVTLEVNWEPRILVYRIDAEPRITRAVDDRGVVLTAPAATASAYPSEAVTDMKVKLLGLTRASKDIAVLAGEFRATAAPKLLAFKFDNLSAKLPVSKTEDRVTATLKSITKADTVWEVEIELLYPEDHPVFESFEEQKWLRDNRLRLVPPGGAKAVEPENEEVGGRGRRVVATYRFPGTLNPLTKGWTAIYETPAPLVEVKVPFELKNIPLP